MSGAPPPPPDPYTFRYGPTNYGYYTALNDYAIRGLYPNFQNYIQHLRDNSDQILYIINDYFSRLKDITTGAPIFPNIQVYANYTHSGFYFNLTDIIGGIREQIGHISIHTFFDPGWAGRVGAFHAINETTAHTRPSAQRYLLVAADATFQLKRAWVDQKTMHNLQNDRVRRFESISLFAINNIIRNVVQAEAEEAEEAVAAAAASAASSSSSGMPGRKRKEQSGGGNIKQIKEIILTVQQKGGKPIQVRVIFDEETKSNKIFFNKKEISSEIIQEYLLPFVDIFSKIIDAKHFIETSSFKNRTNTNREMSNQESPKMNTYTNQRNSSDPKRKLLGGKRRKTRKHKGRRN